MSSRGGQSRFLKKYAFGLLGLAVMLTSINSVLGKIAIEDIPPFLFIGIRYFSIALIFGGIAYHAGQKLKDVKTVHLVVQCLVQAAVGMAWFGSLVFTQAINVSILFLLEPILIYVGSVLFLKEPRSTRALVGALIALIGGLLMFGAPVFSGDGRELIGNGLIMFAVVGYAALILHSKYVITDKNLYSILGLRFLVAGLSGLLLSSFFEDPSTIASSELTSLLALVVSITFAGAFGIWLFYKALEHMRAEDSATLLYLDPLTGSIMGAVVLGETLSSLALVAAGIIVVGVLVAHPVHVNRVIYYHKYKHSKFEEFWEWAKGEYQEITRMVKRYF